jgi:hypothetical protein
MGYSGTYIGYAGYDGYMGYAGVTMGYNGTIS